MRGQGIAILSKAVVVKNLVRMIVFIVISLCALLSEPISSAVEIVVLGSLKPSGNCSST